MTNVKIQKNIFYMKFPSNITTEIRNFVTSFMLKRRFYILKTTVENRHLHIGET